MLLVFLGDTYLLLKAANPAYEPIVLDKSEECFIVGKLVGILHLMQ